MLLDSLTVRAVKMYGVGTGRRVVLEPYYCLTPLLDLEGRTGRDAIVPKAMHRALSWVYLLRKWQNVHLVVVDHVSSHRVGDLPNTRTSSSVLDQIDGSLCEAANLHLRLLDWRNR